MDYDQTKEMLAKVREYRKVLNEELERVPEDEMEQQKEAFKQAVTRAVEFGPILVDRENNNATWSGVLFRKLGWTFSLEDTDGLWLQADNVQVREDTIDILAKLRGYYEVWRDEWFDKLDTEYSEKSFETDEE